MLLRTAVFLLLLCWTTADQPSCLQKRRLIAFGDSLTSVDPNSTVYSSQRQSNGMTWTEYLQGVTVFDWAYSGAVAVYAYHNVRRPTVPRIYLAGQVNGFLSSGVPIRVNDIFLFWIGNNDVKNIIIGNTGTPRQMNQTDYSAIISAITDSIALLAANGGKTFFIVNALDASIIPLTLYLTASNDTSLKAAGNLLVASANTLRQQVKTAVDTYAVPAGTTVGLLASVDIFKNVQSMMSFSPGTCVSTQSTPPTAVVGMAYQCSTFWFDESHPTTIAHQAIAGQITSMICSSLTQPTCSAPQIAALTGALDQVTSLPRDQQQALFNAVRADLDCNISSPGRRKLSFLTLDPDETYDLTDSDDLSVTMTGWGNAAVAMVTVYNYSAAALQQLSVNPSVSSTLEPLALIGFDRWDVAGNLANDNNPLNLTLVTAKDIALVLVFTPANPKGIPLQMTGGSLRRAGIMWYLDMAHTSAIGIYASNSTNSSNSSSSHKNSAVSTAPPTIAFLFILPLFSIFFA